MVSSIHDEEVGAWRVRDMWAPTTLFSGTIFSDPPLLIQTDFEATELQLEETPNLPKLPQPDLYLPPLEDFDLDTFRLREYNAEPLPALESIPDVASSSPPPEEEDQKAPSDVDPSEDIWQLAGLEDAAVDRPKLLSWEYFDNPLHVEQTPAYLSEAGPAMFDAALHLYAKASNGGFNAGNAVQQNAFVRSLWQLGIGIESILFPFDIGSGQFSQAIDDSRFTGCSLECSQGVVQELLDLGNAMAELRMFVEKVYKQRNAIPGKIALANAVTTVQQALEASLVQKARLVQSILQLQAIFQPAKDLITIMQDVVRAVVTAKTNNDIVDILYTAVQKLEFAGEPQDIMFKVLERVSRPWFEEIEASIGLRIVNGPLQSTEITSLQTLAEQSLLSQNLPDVHSQFPACVSVDDQRLIAETQKCYEFMRIHEPNHPLSSVPTYTAASSNLSWALTWEDVDRISQKATQFQTELQVAVTAFEAGEKLPGKTRTISVAATDDLGTSDWPPFGSVHDLEASIAQLDAAPVPVTLLQLPNDLLDVVVNFLSKQDTKNASNFVTPLSLATHLPLSPILEPYHDTLTKSTLRSIISSQSLRTHFSLLNNFFLFGSGSFSFRLATVLFDSNLTSAERRRGAVRANSGRGLGLKIGSGERRAWPPTSSELMLALRGLLGDAWGDPPYPTGLSFSDSIHSAGAQGQSPSSLHAQGSKDALLPGHLSFALRTNLSEGEIDRILEVDSIYALDFLRLSYEAPKALGSVITPVALESYDRIFKHLLRMVRMNFAIVQIFKDILVGAAKRKSSILAMGHSRPRHVNAEQGEADEGILIHRFCHEATHFVNTIAEHTIYTAISQPWTSFQEYLTSLEHAVASPEPPPSLWIPATRQTKMHGSCIPKHDFSLAGLTSTHESTLRTMTTALFLRRRQKKSADALATACNTILRFAKHVRDNARQQPDPAKEPKRDAGDAVTQDSTTDTRLSKVRALYADFTTHVQAFIDTCTAKRDKKLFGGGGKHEPGEAGASGGRFPGEDAFADRMLGELVTRLTWRGDGGAGNI